MKHCSRSNLYKASNVYFNPILRQAASYNWWVFVKVIEGRLVFNNYNYSNTTIRHQWKVKRLLETLNIKIDLEMPVPNGLQTIETLEECILVAEEHLCDKMLNEKIKAQETYQKRKAMQCVINPN